MEIASTANNDTSEDISSSIVLGGEDYHLLAGDCCTGTVEQGLQVHVIVRLMIGVKI